MSALFSAIAVGSFAGDVPFLGVMAAIGALMTAVGRGRLRLPPLTRGPPPPPKRWRDEGRAGSAQSRCEPVVRPGRTICRHPGPLRRSHPAALPVPPRRRLRRTPATPRGRPMTTKIQETGEKVVANVERVIVGKHNEVRLALVALMCRGHLLIEDVPGHRQDRPRQGPRPEPRLLVPADPVHPGPAAVRRDRAVDLQPEDPGVRVPARARSWPRSSSPTRSTGRRRRPSRACSSAWTSARRRSTASPTRCPIRSSSSPPRTRSSTRAPSRCPRRSSTGSCSGSGWATRSRSRRS